MSTEIEPVDGVAAARELLENPRVAPEWLRTLQRLQNRVDVAQATYQEVFSLACAVSRIEIPAGPMRADIDFLSGEVRFRAL